jgi:hypothetical protein
VKHAAAVLAVLLALALTSTAVAARFTSPEYHGRVLASGAGRISWTFESSEPRYHKYGFVAYRLSSEPGWHRCLKYGEAVLENVPPGKYRIEIANDLSMSWIAEHGLLESGLVGECSDSDSPGTPVASDSVTIAPPGSEPSNAPSPTAPVPAPKVRLPHTGAHVPVHGGHRSTRHRKHRARRHGHHHRRRRS